MTQSENRSLIPLRVLVIEDSENDTLLVLREIRKGGYDPLFLRVQNEVELKGALADQQWDLIISDFSMPDFDGLSALNIVRRRELDIPFILVSGTITEENAVSSLRAGAQDFLTKFNLARLLPAINRELKEADVRRERRRMQKELEEYHLELEKKVEKRTAELKAANDAFHNEIMERKQAEEALRESEVRLRYSETSLRLAIEATGLGTFDYYPLTGQLYWSDLAKIHFGLPADASVDYAVFLAGLHPEDRERVHSIIQNVLRPDSGGRYRTEYRAIGITDGKERWLSAQGQVFFNEQGEPLRFTGATVDITERKRAEEQVRRSKELSEALNNIDTAIHSSLDLDTIMQRVVVEAAQTIHVDASSVGLFQNEHFIFRYMHNMPPDLVGKLLSRDDIRGLYYAKEMKEVAIFNNVTDDQRLKTWFWSRYGISSMMIAPLIVRQQVMGAVSFYTMSGPIVFSPEQIDFARKLAASLSLALETARLFDERKKMEDIMRHMAHHDELTGLPNRRLFTDIMKVEMAQARRHKTKLAILFLDLDRFKEINDTLGHHMGDQLLKEVAARFKQTIRQSDSVGRIGGDEFNIVLADINRADDIIDIVNKVIFSLRKPIRVNGNELAITTSIGISVFPDDGDEVETLLRYADMAMYSAKEGGRNAYRFYNPELNIRTNDRMRFEQSLRQTLRKGGLSILYQPLIDIKTGKIVSAEALIRWDHPELGLLEPLRFIPFAEENGLIGQIDEWVLQTVCAQGKAWIDAGLPPVRLTVNLSALHFQNPQLVQIISRALRKSGMPAEALDVEITESTAMSDIERTVAHLRELAHMGIHVSIDDFGSGYSSLNYLKRLPVEKLKIDKSFIQDIADDPDDRAIINAVTAMAHSMKMKVLAEGVETEDQLLFLKGINCDEAQGFLFSKPVAAKELREMISAG